MTRTDRTKASEGSENALTLSPSEGKRNLSQLAFTVAEVAGIFSVSKRQVQYWIASGELSSVAFPGGDSRRLRRITQAQIEAFVRGAELQVGFRRPKAS